jgi:hypothetical protein
MATYREITLLVDRRPLSFADALVRPFLTDADLAFADLTDANLQNAKGMAPGQTRKVAVTNADTTF